MLLRKKLLPGETEAQFNALNHQPENNDHIANYILEHNGQLPPQPMFEKHPYLDDFELQDFDKYIIGTFPPISYVYDHPFVVENIIGQNKLPKIPAFHGNMTSMWKYFFNENELNELLDLVNEGLRIEARDYIYGKLINLRVNYSDIIKNTRRCLNRAGQYDASDDNLYNIYPNIELICHIFNNPNAKYLLFNTSTIFGNSGIKIKKGSVVLNNNAKSFDLFLKTCQELNIRIEISLDFHKWVDISLLAIQQKRNKTYFGLKLIITNITKSKLKCLNEDIETERIFAVTTPFSLAAVHRGMTLRNNIVANWLANHENQNTEDLLKEIYSNFRSEHANLDLQYLNLYF